MSDKPKDNVTALSERRAEKIAKSAYYVNQSVDELTGPDKMIVLATALGLQIALSEDRKKTLDMVISMLTIGQEMVSK